MPTQSGLASRVVCKLIRPFSPLLCLLVLAFPLSAQNTALTLPRNLVQLVDESELIVQGQVTNVSLERHEQLRNLMTVLVTLKVEDSLKGTATTVYTFRQAAIDRRDQQQLLGYRAGQHVLLLLVRPSAYGLSSPAGMQQGRFALRTLPDKSLEAVNGFGNGGLFRGIETQLAARGVPMQPGVRAMISQTKPGPAPLKELKSLIRSIAIPNRVQ
jgi:hypothetical protein